MVIVSTSYYNTLTCKEPREWLSRIAFYTGILESLGAHHQVHSIEQIDYTGSLQLNGVNYHFINSGKQKNYRPFKLHRFIKSLAPGAVLVNGFIFPWQVMLLRWALGKKVKILLLHRGERPPAGFRKQLHRLAGSGIDGYLFTSFAQGEEWMSAGCITDRKKIFEVIQASSVFTREDKTLARQKLNLPDSRLYLWVGRLDENKDPLTVAAGFIQFLRHNPGARLFMIFQQDELLPALQEIISREADKIILVGPVEHPKLQDWYNAADFIISGSKHEGSGIAVCEAMSCGCIPILTRIPSFIKMTGPGKCGLLYEPGSVGDLSAALIKSRQVNIEEEAEKTYLQFSAALSFNAIAKKINDIISPVKIA